jgi:hypothetical protein
MYRDILVQGDLLDDYDYNAASTKAAQLNACVYRAANHGSYTQCLLILNKVKIMEYDSREWYAAAPLKQSEEKATALDAVKHLKAYRRYAPLRYLVRNV